MRPKHSKNKKLSKERIFNLSLKTLDMAMVEFIHKIKTESLDDNQKLKLQELYRSFLLIKETT